MTLAVSNIAWPAAMEPVAADLLQQLHVRAVEIAPTAIWPRPLEATDAEVAAYRAFWRDRGIAIVAMQALLFGRPDLTLFESETTRAATQAYLGGMIDLCARLGGRALVFGSPRNRKRGAMDLAEATRIAVPFFSGLGRRAADAGVSFCIEANPPEYGCDFVTTAEEAVALVREVDSPGFGVHLDAGGMTMTGEPIAAAVASALPWVRHFHASEPNLQPVGGGATEHGRFGAALRAAGYAACVSIEMRMRGADDWPSDVTTAVETARREYAIL